MAEASGNASEPSSRVLETGNSRYHPEERQEKTDTASRRRNDSRRIHAGLNRPYKGKSKQIYRGKETEKVHLEKKGRSASETLHPHGSAEPTTSQTSTATIVMRRTNDERERKIKQSRATPSSEHVSEKKFPGKFSRNHGRREDPGYTHYPTSGTQDERSRKFHENPRYDHHSKSNEMSNEKKSNNSKKIIKGYQGVSRPHTVSDQELSGTYTKKPFVSHGIVAEGVYVRKDKLVHQQPDAGSKQSAYGGNFHQKKFEKPKTDMFSSNKTPGHSNFVKKPMHSGTTAYFNKISINEQARKYNSVGQSSMQAGMLIEQLTDEKYECMVCCEVIKCSKAVWCCSSCYHIFHLFCIKRWARSPAALVEGKEAFI